MIRQKNTECQCTEESTESCEGCCEHHFDPDEGFMCLECGAQGEPSDVYDEDYLK